MPPDQVRREKIQGMVDTGATQLVLPEAVVKRLGLPLGSTVNVRYADGRKARRRRVNGVSVQLLGRDGVFTAICEPKRETALVGAIVLEDLDLLVNCVAQRVVPPRSQRSRLYEIRMNDSTGRRDVLDARARTSPVGVAVRATSSGVPSRRPGRLRSPEPGPRSMIQSAESMTAGLCVITITEWPRSTRALRASSSFRMSRG